MAYSTPGRQGIPPPGDEIRSHSNLNNTSLQAHTGASPEVNTRRSRRSTLSPKQESLIQWFDKAVEKELNKHKDISYTTAHEAADPMMVNEPSNAAQHPLIVETSTSGIDIHSRLCSDMDSDLKEAVDRLAKAEAMCSFAGAVKAAEEAAAAAPPELAEEAAAAGARGFKASITGFLQETEDRAKPVEVIGYIGITRPKKLRKP